MVPILNDAVGSTLTFTVNLTAPVNATLGDAQALGTIQPRPADDIVPMYRTYNPTADYHFFTTSLPEKTNAVANGYQDESSPLPFRVPNTEGPGRVTLFRLYNPNNGRHYYTASPGERDTLMGYGFIYEKDEGFVLAGPATGTVEVFRLYNRNSGAHLYTADPAEVDAVLSRFPGIWEKHTSVGWAYP